MIIDFCPRENQCTAPGFSERLCPVRLGLKSVVKKCSEQQNLFPTVAKQASPRFIRISHLFLLCLSEGNSWNDKSSRFSLRLSQFAAAQHLCPTFFLFFNVCSGQVALNLHKFQFYPNSSDIASAMLVALGLLSLACMQPPVFSGIGVLL